MPQKGCLEEAVLKMSLAGSPSWPARTWESSGFERGSAVLRLLEFVEKRGLAQDVKLGAVNALLTAHASLPSLTLFPFLPGSSAPSLAALRDMTVSTSTPPQTSLSALKSSGT